VTSALAIVSKAVFEKLAGKGAEPGAVLGIDRYTSKHAALEGLAEGGALFLVTVRPPDEALWLVGVLEDPEATAEGWVAAASTQAIADVSAAKAELRFASGTGITAKPGTLGMSLQTPRVLTDGDAALLRRLAGGKAATAKPVAKSAKPAKPTKAAKPAKAAKPTKPTKPAQQPVPLPTAPLPTLDLLEAAIDAGDGAGALDLALSAWRSARSPALADLIDAISARVSGPPITTEAAWNAAASRRTALDVGPMLAGLVELPVAFLPLAGTLLAALPDDPRVAHAVATWAQDPPTTSSSTYPFWTRALDAVARIGDSRVVPLLAKRLKRPPEKSKSKYVSARAQGVSQFWPKFYAALEKTRAKVAALPAATSLHAAPIPALTKRAAKLAPATARAAAKPAAGPPLPRALAHAKAGEIQPAIAALLEAWRANRAPALADVIDRANRLLPSYHRALPADRDAANAAWNAAFAADPFAALPMLVHHLHTGSISEGEHHLLDLASLPDDPRIAIHLAEIARGHTISPERTQYWKTYWEILARTGDVRVLPTLCDEFADFTGTYFDNHRQGRRILAPLLALRDAPPPVLDATAGKLVKQIEAALAALEQRADTTERDLLAAIAGSPADAGPRLVYADWLLEREHPRGELIALACKAKPSEADKKRLKQFLGWRRGGPYLYGAISNLSSETDRGLPTTVVGNRSPLVWRRMPHEPLLLIVEQIAFDGEARGVQAADLAGVLRAPAAGRLREVRKLPVPLATEVASLVAPTWQRKGHNTLVRA
jgi:uncharacterized protein (TIGR02996 family)